METKENVKAAQPTATKMKVNSKVLARLADTSEEGVLNTVAKMTGDEKFAQRFVTYVQAAVRKAWKRGSDGAWVNPFDQVPIQSVLECLYESARRRILPDGYNAYLVTYLGKRPTCKLVIDYKGLCDCAITEGVCEDIGAEIARENDSLEINFGEVTKFAINPRQGRGSVIGCVAWAILPSGRRKSIFVGIDDLEKVRHCARTDDVWSAWTDEMYKKTAIRRLFKTMRNSPRLRDMMEADSEGYELELANKNSKKRGKLEAIDLSANDIQFDCPAQFTEEVADESETQSDEQAEQSQEVGGEIF